MRTPDPLDHPSDRLRAVWRWHFYAGLFCIPFVLWLATTGSIYLFKPQIEAWIDRDADHLAITARTSPAAQVAAAVAAVPGSRFSAYQLPGSPASAAQVLVVRGAEKIRVFVNPGSLAVVKQVPEADRLMNQVFRLHGELMAGRAGSYLVELAASWAIVMLLTGLYLGWPRDGRRLADVLWPRAGTRGRPFWRDIHAVVGFWVSASALFLLISGLPWTQFWGSNLKTLRSEAAGAPVRQDWTTGSAHAGHRHAPPDGAAGYDLAALDRLVATVTPLKLAPPVLIAPPGKDGADGSAVGNGQWTARSEAQNRPLRVTLTLDGASGAVLRRRDFSQQPLLDRVIGTGIAAHEGQLFGWPNQLLGLVTALGLITLCLSAIVLWWRRRPAGRLGAPLAADTRRPGYALIVAIALLGLLLPLFGASLLTVWLIERRLLSRWPAAQRFLGLESGA